MGEHVFNLVKIFKSDSLRKEQQLISRKGAVFSNFVSCFLANVL